MAWHEEGSALVQDYEFGDFAGAIRFVNEVARLAEAKGHHPDILIHGWNKVRLTLSTHTSGTVTDLDRGLAADIDDL
ncbi:4a-hydroxytetrahydrobiopterin dehydratase [Capillimicrobium parvum]|uniref:Putative pterin-4-alpha-carbinolamine dehydratase n=1 Tax=Capillimicrobium parvum TaxID=2884022 RepID=A0A9E7C2W1_9ACTN|nr:4a-hydroxytetrahydrobiopterin dehydratase [Capillimicrobium parvum]UGS37888.1 Putative pterin-4-alpha-carbinolamine dehydratase [Capillimicrobium parvum]